MYVNKHPIQIVMLAVAILGLLVAIIQLLQGIP